MLEIVTPCHKAQKFAFEADDALLGSQFVGKFITKLNVKLRQSLDLNYVATTELSLFEDLNNELTRS